MKVGVVSSRKFEGLDNVVEILTSLADSNGWSYPSVAVGGNGGVDGKVKDWCKLEKLDYFTFLPYFVLDSETEFTPRMFFAKNNQIVDNTNLLIAFGDDNDTKQAIKRASEQGKDVIIVA